MEFQRKIDEKAYLEILLDFTDEVCYTEEKISVVEGILDVRQTEKQIVPSYSKSGSGKVMGRLLCYGDSNTYGYDPRSYLGGRYPESIRWTALLNGPDWTVINEGENGRSIPRPVWEIETAVQVVARSNADVLIVMLGSNDLLQCPGLSAEVCGERMERFLMATLTETPKNLKVMLAAPPPMEPGTWVEDFRTLEESGRLAKCYEKVAHRLGIVFADAGAWSVELAYDGVHFSEEGHRTFAGEIRKILNNWI